MARQIGDLKPCPFCGKSGEAEFSYELGRWDIWNAGCRPCDIWFECDTGLEGEAAAESAILKWERRA